jgi:hypothetical protein
MNYFAHAIHFLDEPYFAAGTALPDWLTAADRGVRLRGKRVRPFLRDPAPHTALLAGGVLQHICDDTRFHESRAFTGLWLELTATIRSALGDEAGLRPGFLAHLLVEVLLDASLVAEDPGRLRAYYGALESVDALLVQQAVNRMATRHTARLAAMISEFRRQEILWDYLEDATLSVRLNQVLRRARCEPLPAGFAGLLPEARRLVESRRSKLLQGFPTDPRENRQDP